MLQCFILGVTSMCVTLTITGVGLVVVPITCGVAVGLCIFSKIVGENLKQKEQHIIKNNHLLVEQ